MIKGIEIFKEYFRDYKEQYVLIGGGACDLIFEDIGADFRATKDLDLVLIVEALTPEFGKRFWDFIRDGGYKNKVKSDGKLQFYRFDKPQQVRFPFMIELFTRVDAVFDDNDHGCVPIHLGEEISSLSAILMNEDYYRLLVQGKTIVADVVILSHIYLIPFKAKAWLDLSQRRATVGGISERDIKKHKNNIVRLASILTGNERCELQEGVKADMQQFIAQFEEDPAEPKELNIPGLTAKDIIEVLHKVYL